jgi:hypothetical protein
MKNKTVLLAFGCLPEGGRKKQPSCFLLEEKGVVGFFLAPSGRKRAFKAALSRMKKGGAREARREGGSSPLFLLLAEGRRESSLLASHPKGAGSREKLLPSLGFAS